MATTGSKSAKSERSNKSTKWKAKKDIPFGPFKITLSTVELAITLLQSKEPDVLFETLKALNAFALSHRDNRQLIFELGAVHIFTALIDYPHWHVRRHALINLALMCLLPEVRTEILENPENMKKLVYQMVKVEDIFVLEYASLCIARLTVVEEGYRQLVETNILGTLFKRIKESIDPDVQKNCLETLSNLLEDPLKSREVTKNPQFNWNSILPLTSSKFIGLQNVALKMVGQLVSRYDDTPVQTKFKASTGVKDLFEILKSYELRHTHPEVLNILRLFVVVGDNVVFLHKLECIPILHAYLANSKPTLKPHCLAVLSTMSETDKGKEVVFKTETDLLYCEVVLGSNEDMLAEAIRGICNMCSISLSAQRMFETGVVETLCSIIVEESLSWETIRINTLKSLCALCKLFRPPAVSVTKSETFTLIRKINVKYEDYPEAAQMLALELFRSLMTQAEVALKAMLQDSFVTELLDILRRVNIKLQIPAANVLSFITQCELGKDLFTANGGEQVVSDILKINHNGLRNALCQLIINSATYEGAEVYQELGTISYMLENPARLAVDLWENACKKILEKNPSAKFAFLGRLDPEDVTNDGFYVLKRLDDSFPSISKIMSKTSPAVSPVYIAILYPQHHRYSLDLGIRSPHRKMSRGLLTSTSILNRNSMGMLPDDDNLKEYVLKLRHVFGDKGRSRHYVEILKAQYDVRERKVCEDVGSSTKGKAEILADYVVKEMNNTHKDTNEENCLMPSVELHIAELLKKFSCGVIGIGFVKYGGILERAILYKVLADRLGIPCAIYRKCSAIAWCEVAVPELSKEPYTDSEEKYPAKYLRVNYVVDLSDNAKERLYREGGYDAKRVIGPPMPPYVVDTKGSQ